MKKKTFLQLCVGCLILLLPYNAFTQARFADSLKTVKKELTNYKMELESIYESFDTENEYENDMKRYDDCSEQLMIFFEPRKTFIAEYSTLYSIWSDIKQIRDDIDEKIEVLKKKQELKKTLTILREDLELTCTQYKILISQFQNLDQMKRNPASDTLAKLKNRDAELFNEYSIQKTQHKELIAQEPTVDSLCDFIEASHKTISEAKDIEKIKWGDIIFKVTLVLAVLFFIINLIVSKAKLKKQLNGKKNKHIPSI